MGHMRAIKRPSTSTYDPYSIDRVCEALLLICRRLSLGHNQHSGGCRYRATPRSGGVSLDCITRPGVDIANRTQ